ncbi:MAG: hypothetical protein Kow0042_28310 [Calditrichia bacterium]
MRISRKTFTLLLILTSLFSFLGLWNFTLRPDLSGTVFFTKEKQILYQSVESGSPRILREINGIAVREDYQIEAIVDRHRIGDTLNLHFDDDSGETVTLVRRYRMGHVLLNAGLALAFLFLSTLVFFKQKSAGEIYFSFSGLCFAFILATSWSGIELPFFVAVIPLVLYYFAYPQAFVFFYRFSLQFPAAILSPKGIRTRCVLLQIVGLLFTILLTVAFLNRYFHLSLASIEFYQQNYSIFRIFIFLTLLISLLNIYRNTRRQPDPVNRRKAMWLFWGAFWGSFPFIFLWSLPQLWGNPLIPEWLAHIFIFLLPVCLVIAITRYRLFDIEIVLSRSVTYSLFIFLLVAAYIFFTGALSLILIRQFSLKSPFISILSAVAVALVFQPLKERVQNLVNKNFFRIRYDRFQALQAYRQELELCSRSEEILEKLYTHFQQFVPLKWQQLAWRNDGTHFFGKGPFSRPYLEDLLNRAGNNAVIVNSRRRDRVEHSLEVKSDFFPEGAVVILVMPRRLVWVWGEKISGQRFWKEDLDLGEEMARAAVLQVEKIGYYQRALREAYRKQEAEKQSQWKSLLVSEVAHDLRAPLNTMLWKLRNLQEDLQQLTPILQKPLEELEQHLNRMQDFIHNLLLLSQDRRGSRALQLQSVSLQQVCQNVATMISGVLEQKKITLQVNVGPEVSIMGIPFLLQEVLLNLVQNSAKYSPSGSTIRIQSRRVMRRGKEKIQLQVIDEAGGIDKKAFSPGFPDSYTLQQWEIGKQSFRLGLYIVREFMRKLQGELNIQSKAGKGSIISLYFKPA